MATITVKGGNPLSRDQRVKALQFMADHLTDDELNKLHQLAKSDNSRKALTTKWDFIKTLM